VIEDFPVEVFIVWLNILLLAILASIVIYLFARRGGLISAPPEMSAKPTDDELSGKMRHGQLLGIVAYLLILGLSLVYMEVSLLALDFPDTPPTLTASGPAVETETLVASVSQEAKSSETDPKAKPSNTTDNNPKNTSGNDSTKTDGKGPAPQESPAQVAPPTIVAAMPKPNEGGGPNGFLTVYGTNFSDKSQVRFNGRIAPTKERSATSMTASLTPADAVDGKVAIEVVDGDKISNAVTLGLPLRKPTAPLNVLALGYVKINREIQLLLIIVFAGALGSYIHCLKSATAFIGNGTMKESWFWWYISGPFVGMAMALIFYAVLRGGFLAGTPADEKVVNPFGVAAVGALVGMFADKASMKLGEIFDTLFKSGDPRSDKLDAPVITSLDPSKVQAGQSTPQMIKIVGERLGKVTSVRVNSTAVKADVVSDREVQFTLQPSDLQQPGTLKIVVVDGQGGSSISASLAVVAAAAPKITGPEKLKPATVNTPYEEKITAANCNGSCQWSLKGDAGGLTIDPATGTLTGTPTVAGPFSFTVAVRDENQQVDEKTYDLVVN
jgi:hypothetical protein